MSSKFKILSIDGGGLKGLIPLQIIKEIEKITKQPIHKTFDLIAGTSTGGLLACSLLLKDEKSIQLDQRKYSLEQIEEIYLKKGEIIFPRYRYIKWILMKVWEWFLPKYCSKEFMKILNELFGDYTIKDCLRPIFITSFDIKRYKPVFFTRREANQEGKNAALVDVCRATSAAPTYFSTHNFSYDSERLFCIDGGLVMNNPTLGALFEVLSHFPEYNKAVAGNLRIKDIMILSLSTSTSASKSTSTVPSSKIKHPARSKYWGRAQWIKKIIDISIDGPVDVVHNQLQTFFRSMELYKNYQRVVIPIDMGYTKMDDSRAKTLNSYIEKTQAHIKGDPEIIDNIKFFLREAGLFTYDTPSPENKGDSETSS